MESVLKPSDAEHVGERTNLPALNGLDLFPTRIWQARLPQLAGDLSGWAAASLALRERMPASASRSIRRSWSSANLDERDRLPFRKLLDVITAYCRFILNEEKQKDIRFGIQSWINIQDDGGFNFLHAHCGALLSGCFYIEVPKGSGNLVLKDPRPTLMSASGMGLDTVNDIALAPEAGLLRIFPAWLEHLVEPHEGGQPRIVLSFNAVKL